MLGMKGGLNDYDGDAIFNWTLMNPDDDITPLDFLYTVDKTWHSLPGEIIRYSSVGYGLLGLALAQHAGV